MLNESAVGLSTHQLMGDTFPIHVDQRLQVWKMALGEAAFWLVKKSDGKAVLEFGKMTWKI